MSARNYVVFFISLKRETIYVHTFIILYLHEPVLSLKALKLPNFAVTSEQIEKSIFDLILLHVRIRQKAQMFLSETSKRRIIPSSIAEKNPKRPN